MILACSLVAVVTLFIIVLARLSPDPGRCRTYSGIDDSTWIESFSIAKYEPLLRLASGEDDDYVKWYLQGKAAVDYQRVRRALMRDYLHALHRDFNRIHSIATTRLVHASEDRENLPLTLVEQQMHFIFQVWTIEAKLIFGKWVPCRMDLEDMLRHIEGLAGEARRLSRPQLSYQVM